jgi:hypothetical protein
MKTKKPRKHVKAPAQPCTTKNQLVKTGIKIRSGLRAGYHQMGFMDMY